ncbi:MULTISPECIES: hypothetical protein [unclassified Methanoculleus]|uniref:Uncharacterized protein n=1 Tax=Methanoculleus palmolei TaxID=72612 RepID=A0ABD8ABJ7_9EURY|nr:hypothetical protein R6Y95_04320 [Methanoculleus palmolei]
MPRDIGSVPDPGAAIRRQCFVRERNPALRPIVPKPNAPVAAIPEFNE